MRATPKQRRHTMHYQGKFRVIRISVKTGVQFLADYDGIDYLWSKDEADTITFDNILIAHQAACNLPGFIRVEGWTGNGWAVDFNHALENRHR